jgi:hypothetical protein
MELFSANQIPFHSLLTRQALIMPISTRGMNAAKHQNATLRATSGLFVSENPE